MGRKEARILVDTSATGAQPTRILVELHGYSIAESAALVARLAKKSDAEQVLVEPTGLGGAHLDIISRDLARTDIPVIASRGLKIEHNTGG